MNVVFKTNADLLTQRIHDLLQTVGTLNNQLQADGMCKNVRLCLEATLINALNRLDDLLTDKTRWAQHEIDLQNTVGRKLENDNQLQGYILANAKRQDDHIGKMFSQGTLVTVEEVEPTPEPQPNPTKTAPPKPPRRKKKD